MKEYFSDIYWAVIGRPWNKVVHWKDELIYAWERATKGYDRTAHWGLSSYIADIALPVLKSYRNGGKCGMPFNHETDDWHTEEEWAARLDKMITAFEIMHDHDFMEGKWWDLLQSKRDEGHYGEELQRQWKIKQDGFKEFAEYFESLWD